MAFNIWKIGLHIQQHEALAVAVVHDASGRFLQRWWRIPLTPQLSSMATFASLNSLSQRYCRGAGSFLADTIFISLFLPTGRYKKSTLVRK